MMNKFFPMAIFAALLAFAASTSAQSLDALQASDFGLPEGAVLMWPTERDAPRVPSFHLPPEDFPVPDGYHASEALDILSSACTPTITGFVGACQDSSGTFSAGGINESGQICTCGLLQWPPCQWTNAN